MIAPGTRIGKYELGELLGSGGFGMVYAARDTRLDRTVAIKFLLPEHTRRPEVVHRFFREARTAKINHPGVVTVFECEVVENAGGGLDGMAYIAMELLVGETLAARIARGPLPIPQAIEIARQVASAVEAAHAADIIHRDLKPANIFLVPDPATVLGERVKVLDFGIAKLAGDAAEAAPIKTHTLMIFGSPPYMSPEQCRSTAKVDERTDIYALGCIVFEMVTGRTPFVGDTGELIGLHQHVAPPAPRSLRDVPASLDALILAMLAKDPAARPPTMAAVIERLGARVPTSREPEPAIATPAERLERLGADVPASAPAPAAISPTLPLAGAPATGPTPSPARPPLPSSPDARAAVPANPTLPLPAEQDAAERPASPDAPAARDAAHSRTPGPASPDADAAPDAAGARAPVHKGPASPEASARDAAEARVSATRPADARAESVRREATGSRPRRWPFVAVGAVVAVGSAVAIVASLNADPGECPAGMVRVPGGDIRLGALGEPSLGWIAQARATRLDNFGVVDHTVDRTVTVGTFCLDRTEVTAEAYRKCVDGGRCREPVTRDPACTYAGAGTAAHPINCVDYTQARVYCAATGRRLPTDAEWERAVRGDRHRRYPWGDAAPTSRLLNACGDECTRPRGDQPMFGGSDGFATTAPVGSFPDGATPEGILDLAGNVAEWVDGGDDIVGQTGTPPSPLRSIRGGAWTSTSERQVRASIASAITGDAAVVDLGFRCAR